MTIHITKMEYFAEDIRQLTRDLPQLKKDAMADAIVHSGVLDAIGKKTPKSDRYRYAYRYKAIERDDWMTSGKALKRGWRKKIADANGYNSLDRLDQYGQLRLFKSLFGGSDEPTIDGLEVGTGPNTVRFTIGSDLPYAKRMHEATNIDGYWSSSTRGIGGKRGKGWSTRGTGPKFISGPVAENRDAIHDELVEGIRIRLEEAMSE